MTTTTDQKPPPIDVDRWLTRAGSAAGLVSLALSQWPAVGWWNPAAIGAAVAAAVIFGGRAIRRWWWTGQ